jgi:hypothetical protein
MPFVLSPFLVFSPTKEKYLAGENTNKDEKF